MMPSRFDSDSDSSSCGLNASRSAGGLSLQVYCDGGAAGIISRAADIVSTRPKESQAKPKPKQEDKEEIEAVSEEAERMEKYKQVEERCLLLCRRGLCDYQVDARRSEIELYLYDWRRLCRPAHARYSAATARLEYLAGDYALYQKHLNNLLIEISDKQQLEQSMAQLKTAPLECMDNASVMVDKMCKGLMRSLLDWRAVRAEVDVSRLTQLLRCSMAARQMVCCSYANLVSKLLGRLDAQPKMVALAGRSRAVVEHARATLNVRLICAMLDLVDLVLQVHVKHVALDGSWISRVRVCDEDVALVENLREIYCRPHKVYASIEEGARRAADGGARGDRMHSQQVVKRCCAVLKRMKAARKALPCL